MPRLSPTTLLVLAAFGLVIPNAYYIPWVVRVWPDVGAMFRDPIAMAFALDATIAMIWIAAWTARVRWPWFVVMSCVAGMGFAIPFWMWLNRDRGAA